MPQASVWVVWSPHPPSVVHTLSLVLNPGPHDVLQVDQLSQSSQNACSVSKTKGSNINIALFVRNIKKKNYSHFLVNDMWNAQFVPIWVRPRSNLESGPRGYKSSFHAQLSWTRNSSCSKMLKWRAKNADVAKKMVRNGRIKAGNYFQAHPQHSSALSQWC